MFTVESLKIKTHPTHALVMKVNLANFGKLIFDINIESN